MQASPRSPATNRAPLGTRFFCLRADATVARADGKTASRPGRSWGRTPCPHFGPAKIDTGVGAVFNMTPSPGATCCLENAEVDMRTIAEFLGATIDEARFAEDLLIDDQRHVSQDLPAHLISGAEAA